MSPLLRSNTYICGFINYLFAFLTLLKNMYCMGPSNTCLPQMQLCRTGGVSIIMGTAHDYYNAYALLCQAYFWMLILLFNHCLLPLIKSVAVIIFLPGIWILYISIYPLPHEILIKSLSTLIRRPASLL